VDLCPCGDEARLPDRKTPADNLDVVDREFSNAALVLGVEMGPMVWSTSLHKHPDYDAEEAADSGNAPIPPGTRFSFAADNWCPSARHCESARQGNASIYMDARVTRSSSTE
jgi:rubredoxin